MKPEDRLAEARKHLRLAAEDDEVSENQQKAIRGVVDIVSALEDSIRVQRDNLMLRTSDERWRVGEFDE